MLKQLGTSHTGFFHEKRARAAGRIAIAATLMKAQTGDGIRWMFQDVHPGGVAAQAGIQSGDVLLKIGDKELSRRRRCRSYWARRTRSPFVGLTGQCRTPH